MNISEFQVGDQITWRAGTSVEDRGVVTSIDVPGCAIYADWQSGDRSPCTLLGGITPTIDSSNNKRRKHADVITSWANDATAVVEYRHSPTDSWRRVQGLPTWEAEEYRIAPRPMRSIRGPDGVRREYPTPCTLDELTPGDTCYYIDFLGDDPVDEVIWHKSYNALVTHGVVHLTHEACRAHANAILGTDRE